MIEKNELTDIRKTSINFDNYNLIPYQNQMIYKNLINHKK